MRLRDIEWDRVATVAITTIMTAALLFVSYKGYEDHVMLGQLVSFLNAQVAAQQPKIQPAPPANVQSNPEVKK